MGLDLVEYVIAVEEVFGVDIDDAALEREKIDTVGDFVPVLRRELRPVSGDRCPTQVVFHRLRSSVVPALAAREQVRPGNALTQVMSADEWRRDWTRIGARMGLEMPPLVLPRWWRLVWGTAVGSSAATV